ncbi:SRPBCC family protein [Rhodococcus sp. MSC1_016]|jgi:hypothetical protein|uniref:SRPBCC family protein n=1 Tax=Rhodococcus sp. MSC1_016 TaxID=2909266 RepID=UPI0035B12C3D
MRVEVVKTVSNSIDRVWALVSDFGSPDKVDPEIKTLSAQGEGVGAVREIALPEGASATELCVVCDPETFTLAYTILPPRASCTPEELCIHGAVEVGRARQNRG